MKAAVKQNKWRVMGVIGRMHLTKSNMDIFTKIKYSIVNSNDEVKKYREIWKQHLQGMGKW